MTSTRFWLLFCLLIVLAIVVFGSPVFARKAQHEPKTHRPHKSKPVIVKIGKPYLYELPKK